MRLAAVRTLTAWVLLAQSAAVLVAPATAFAAAEDPKAWAKKGAEAFNKGDFLGAARAFEKAAQLDPSDPKNLRYAGRAWQQVGHWKRALVLLEMYLKIETNPEHRASIMEFVEPLRRATPRQVAEALDAALARFPQGRLEGEAAQLWEDLDDEAAVQHASELWELARVRAATDGDRQAAEAGARRASQRVAALKAQRLAAQQPKDPVKPDGVGLPQNPTPVVQDKQPPVLPPPVANNGSSTLRTTLLISGGVLVIGGAVLGTLGYLGAQDVNDRANKGEYKSNPDAYFTDKGAKDNLAYAGWSALAVGVGLGVWGALTSDGTPARVTLVPQLGPGTAGLALASPF